MSKAQLELSVNTIVIIVISVVIVATGIVMLYKFQRGLTNTAYTLDKQTEQLLKSFMLKNNYNVAVYPQYVTLAPGANTLIGLGITNNMDNTQQFDIDNLPKVIYYNIYSNPVTPSAPINCVNNWCAGLQNKKSSVQMTVTAHDVNPKDQYTGAILINVPKDAPRGEYEITLTVRNRAKSCTTGSCPISLYGTVKIYVTTG